MIVLILQIKPREDYLFLKYLLKKYTLIQVSACISLYRKNENKTWHYIFTVAYTINKCSYNFTLSFQKSITKTVSINCLINN